MPLSHQRNVDFHKFSFFFQTSNCIFKAQIMAISWTTFQVHYKLVKLMITWRKNSSWNFSICERKLLGLWPRFWITLRTPTWLITSSFWLLEPCTKGQLVNWYQNVINWEVSSKWKPFTLLPLQLNYTTPFWWTRLLVCASAETFSTQYIVNNLRILWNWQKIGNIFTLNY